MCSDCFDRFYNCCKLWSCWCLRVLNTQIWSLWLLPTRARLMTNQFIRIPGFDFNMSNIKHLSDPTSMHWCEERLSHVGNHQLLPFCAMIHGLTWCRRRQNQFRVVKKQYFLFIVGTKIVCAVHWQHCQILSLGLYPTGSCFIVQALASNSWTYRRGQGSGLRVR